MLINTSKTTAPTHTNCDACGRTVNAGESVNIVTSWWRGEALAFVECPVCERLLADFGERFADADGAFQLGCVADALGGGTAAELLASLQNMEKQQNNGQA